MTRGNKGKGWRLKPSPRKKRCSSCRLLQLIKHFNQRGESSDGYRGQCKKCLNKRGRNASDRKRYLKRKYGITVEQYDLILKKQGACCAICGGINPNGQRLAIDHDHKTGHVRGLLCSKCNRGLGKFEDSIQLLQAAINYLKETK